MDKNRRRWIIAAISLLLLITMVLLAVARGDLQGTLLSTNPPTPSPEPIVPTRTPTSASVSYPSPSEGTAPAGPTAVSLPEATSTSLPKATATQTAVPEIVIEGEATTIPATGTPSPLLVTSELARFGVSIARKLEDVEAAYGAGLPFGSTQNWNVNIIPPAVPAEYWQMVRIDQEGIRKVDWDYLAEAIAANPDSKWLIGNEPDVIWQDNVTPERYAEIYHDVYTFIKDHDPGAEVAIGGVSQPTPLRRAYLDIVLDAYQAKYGRPMPIDIWNVHAFTLREEADSWGVGIPPGMEGQQGILYEIEDHDDVEIIAQNLLDFRRWMAERGYGDKPLVISEYGILMPEDYGFPPQRVAAFQAATFDLFREMAGRRRVWAG